MPIYLQRQVQPKLRINQPGDAFEQEAEAVATRVVNPEAKPTLSGGARDQPRPAASNAGFLAKENQNNSGVGSVSDSAAPPIVEDALHSPGQPLDPVTRDFMEPRFGCDFSGVRVHADTVGEKSAEDVSAHAYTVGSNIVFGRGQFAPGTEQGRRLIAHELTHVVHQTSRKSALQRQSSDTKEREKWRSALKNKDLPTAREYSDEEDTPFFVEGLIETSKLLEPYVTGKLAKTSVAKNFYVYGSKEEFDYKAEKLVGEKPRPGIKFGGFYDRLSDSIHLPPRAPFAHALHEGIHKYSSGKFQGQFSQFLNEGVTQYFADRVQDEHKVEGRAKNEYGPQQECAITVLGWLDNGEKALAEAYFQGIVDPVKEVIFLKLGIKTEAEFAKLKKDKGAELCKHIKQA